MVQDVDYDTARLSVVGGWAGRRVERTYPPSTKDTWDEYGPPDGCAWPDDGEVWLLSRAQAVTLYERRQELLDFVRQKVERSPRAFYCDIWIPVVASWGGGRLYHSTALVNLKAHTDCMDDSDTGSTMASMHIKDLITGGEGNFDTSKTISHGPNQAR